MNTKLTLSLDRRVIKPAKSYARKQRLSLSKLVENYLHALAVKPAAGEVSALVESLTGVLPSASAGDDYRDYLRKKYS